MAPGVGPFPTPRPIFVHADVCVMIGDFVLTPISPTYVVMFCSASGPATFVEQDEHVDNFLEIVSYFFFDSRIDHSPVCYVS